MHTAWMAFTTVLGRVVGVTIYARALSLLPLAPG
jgi:hypothetical protein